MAIKKHIAIDEQAQSSAKLNPAYAKWIEENVPETYGVCATVTLRMQEDFPELRRVRGHYFCFAWGERAHWWLLTDGGDVVDPTAAQFPSRGRGVYILWDESAAEPTGRCMNCGGYTFDHSATCSDDCHTSLMSDFK